MGSVSRINLSDQVRISLIVGALVGCGNAPQTLLTNRATDIFTSMTESCESSNIMRSMLSVSATDGFWPASMEAKKIDL